MNDKLSQSLKARLSGMQWGEGEQAEVHRQIQRKEMQDVKHAKRGAGMLAIAVTLLFLVAGAVFAVGTMPQPEDSTALTQPSGAELAQGKYTHVTGEYLKRSPRLLFPYDGDDSSDFNLIVIRVDGSVDLPETLPIHITKWTKAGYFDVADLLLIPAP